MKIIHLETAEVEQVELKAIEDLSFMQVIDGDDPQHGGLSNFISADDNFQVGMSTYTKVSLKLTDWPTSEFMYFLEGQVEITDEGGESTVYGRVSSPASLWFYVARLQARHSYDDWLSLEVH